MAVRLMIAAGCAVGALALTSCRLEAQTRIEGTFDRTLPISGPLTLDIRTGSGSIQIHRGPTDSIHVVGRMRAGRSWVSGDVEERVRRIEMAPPIAQMDGVVQIGPMDDDRLFRNISISYDVTVPEETRVHSRTGSGGQTISDLSGPVDARAGSGSIHLRAIRNDARASTGSGSIQIEDVGNFFGRAGSGGIRAEAVRGGVDARVGSGSIRIAGRPTADWDVETGSGTVSIDFPEDAAFDLNVRTGSGSINTTHPLAVVGSISRNRLRGTVRGGGARVELSTGSGSIHVD